MASSPRTMWTGTIELDSLVTIPVNIGKAFSDTRESSLVTVCDHRKEANEVVPVDRSERCKRCEGPPKNKVHAVEVEEGVYRIFEESEFESIEAATKTQILKVLDVQPLSKLPLMYSTGCYYVRPDMKVKGANAKPFKALCLALAKDNLALVAKWGNSSRQKLVVISVVDGVMILCTLPFVEDIRPAAKMERAHWSQEIHTREFEKVGELLTEIHKRGSRWSEQYDEGLRMRQEAVEKILNDEDVEIPKVAEVEPGDFFDKLDIAIAAVRS
jgi:non-homologous end joining protein Ku